MKRKLSKKKLEAIRKHKELEPELYDRSKGWCEVAMPGICEGRAINTHHRLPLGQGGEESLDNYLHLCGSGTTGCHGWIEHHRAMSYSQGWLVHMGSDPALIEWSPA